MPETTETTETTPTKLRTWRLEIGLSQQEVADLLGRDHSYVSKLERGEYLLTPLKRVQIARRLGCRVAELFDPVETVESAGSELS